MGKGRSRSASRLSLAGAALALVACSDGGGVVDVTDPKVVASVALDRTDARILVGNRVRLVATAFDASGRPVADPGLMWASSDPSVVTVDGTGLVEAVGEGSASVTAEVGSVRDVVAVDVPEPVGVAGPAGASLIGAGGDVQLEIPAGALATERSISVVDAAPESLPDDPRTGALIPGTAYEFGPSGLQFAKPARVTIAYDPGKIPDGIFEDQLRVYRGSESGWTEMEGLAISRSGQRVSAVASGFSVYAVGVDENRAPSVSFTVDCVGLACQFTDQSSDPDGSLATRAWDFGDGETSTETSPSHAFAQAGEYTVVLRGTDDAGTSASSVRVVTVAANAPVASFTADCEDLTCDFTDQSLDTDGSVVTHAWSFGDGTTSSEQSPTHVYADEGTYTVTLSVTDDDGLSDDTQQTVSVTDPPGLLPPAAAFSFSCTKLACSFTDQSEDIDGGITVRAWSFGDGSTSTSRNPQHTYASGGTYAVSLEVTDTDGLFDTATRSVTVSNPPGLPPVADFLWTCSGVSCDFTDTSTDPDGNNTITRAWDFGDGATSTQRNPSHSYATAGMYTVSLTVTDNDGSQDVAEETLTIVPQLQSGTDVTGLSAGVGEQLYFQITVPSGQGALRVEIEGSIGDPFLSDADLYLRRGSLPTPDMFECRPFLSGDDETCTIDNPQQGIWYIGLFGVFGFEGVTLRATYGSGGS